jgi:hypothetical protein
LRAAKQALGRWMWRQKQRLPLLRASFLGRLRLLGLRRQTGPRTRSGAALRTDKSVGDIVHVVMCVWRRPHNLPATLASLQAQSHHPIKLCIWNNNRSLRLFVDATVARVADLDVEVIHSSRNIGGFGRYYFARQLAGRHPYVIFLDDDQVPAPGFVRSLIDEFSPQSIRGIWGYRFHGTARYGDRTAANPGERIKYCGTGGMICDTSAFLTAELFSCPKRFWFGVEDLWLSYYADHVLGWPLYKSGAEILTQSDEHDISRVVYPNKQRLFRYLVRRGWDPVGDS